MSERACTSYATSFLLRRVKLQGRQETNCFAFGRLTNCLVCCQHCSFSCISLYCTTSSYLASPNMCIIIITTKRERRICPSAKASSFSRQQLHGMFSLLLDVIIATPYHALEIQRLPATSQCTSSCSTSHQQKNSGSTGRKRAHQQFCLYKSYFVMQCEEFTKYNENPWIAPSDMLRQTRTHVTTEASAWSM
jgi:hypothetical protein